MADAVLDAMGEVLTRWTMGSAAAPAAVHWKNELGAEPEEAELRLLALSGQFLGTAVTVAPPAELRMLPDVPALSMPTVPEAARPLVRRLLAAKLENQLLRFIALRGWTMHPADWMPDANDEGVPDVYAPWRDWAALAASTMPVQRALADRITPENWADWWPAARKVALIELRRSDPAAARVVLEAKLAGENADVRLRLLALLESRLSEDDVSFLEGIAATDRAPKVKALATSLLARMNRACAGSADDLAELKGFFTVKTKGLLRRSRVIEFENMKTPAQRQRRAALLKNVEIAAFAGTLAMKSEQLIDAWPWGTDNDMDFALMALIRETGNDALVMHTVEVVTKGELGGLYRLVALSPRLTNSQLAELAVTVLKRGDCHFHFARSIASGTSRVENPLGTPAGAALLDAVGRVDAKSTDQVEELQALGLITGHAWARPTLDRLNAAGVVQGDPRLDMLRLNEALEDRGVMS
jgi:hypothetical protein